MSDLAQLSDFDDQLYKVTRGSRGDRCVDQQPGPEKG